MTVGAQLKQTIAGLKGAQGTMRIYANQSRHMEVRTAFRESLDTLGEVLIDLEKRLSVLEFEEKQYQGY